MNDLSVWRLILEATVVVQLVMLLLLAASVYAWAVVFRKRAVLRRARDTLARFEREFWSGGDLGTLYRSIESRGDANGIEAVFQAGFREFARQRQQGVETAEQMLDGARRAMKAQQIKEIEHLEHQLSALATVGSTSPYVGLFGTVWGIMRSFTAIADQQNTSLAVVAPGIAEALFATAIGLFAAIPAVIAYNRFGHGLNMLESRLTRFADGFHATLSRELER